MIHFDFPVENYVQIGTFSQNASISKKAPCSSDENSLLLETFTATPAEGLGEKVPLVTLGTSVPLVKDSDSLPVTHTPPPLSGGWTQQYPCF